jgi:Ni/Co efflux regulator RcnB
MASHGHSNLRQEIWVKAIDRSHGRADYRRLAHLSDRIENRGDGMKRFLICAAAAALLLPTLVLAQPGQNNGRPDQGNRPGGNGPGRPDRPVTLPMPVPGRPDQGNRPGGNGPGRPDRPVTLPMPVPGRPDRPNPVGPGVRPLPPRPGPGMRPPVRPGRPQFSWRGRYFNPIRGSLFRYPPGYGYRRWSIGAFLPGEFLSAHYYYDDWRVLGVDPPPPGRRWVRYGPDLLLVNQRDRRVEDVIYNVFY